VTLRLASGGNANYVEIWASRIDSGGSYKTWQNTEKLDFHEAFIKDVAWAPNIGKAWSISQPVPATAK